MTARRPCCTCGHRGRKRVARTTKQAPLIVRRPELADMSSRESLRHLRAELGVASA